MNRRMAIALLAAFAAFVPATADAQSKYPERPIQIIAPFAPGGAADVLSRFFSKELETRSASRSLW